MDHTEDINLYRQVPTTEHFHGYNSHGQKDALLFVYQSNDKSLAREYYRKNPFWKCIGCKKFDKKVYIRVMGKEVYAPLKHFCQPRSVEEIVKEQQEYQNTALYGDGENMERKSAFYASSKEFDKFDYSEYKFGVNNVKRPNSRLIVQQKNNSQNVYHYRQQGKRWICRGCFSINQNSEVFGEFVKKILYLPKEHICEPYNAEESEQEQQNLIFGKASDLTVDKIFNEEKNSLRILYHYEFEFGVTRAASIDEKKKIIVCDQSNRTLAYEFNYKSPSIWQCTKCVQRRKSNTYVIEKDGNMYVSMRHKCNIIKYFDIMMRQQAILNPGEKKFKIERLAIQKGKAMPMPKDNRPTTISAAVQVPTISAGICLPTFSARPPSIAASTRSMRRKASKKITYSETASVSLRKIRPSKPSVSGTSSSDNLTKIRRYSNKAFNNDTVIKVLTPKRSSFPVRMPPAYSDARQEFVQPKYEPPAPPPIISLAPVFLGSSNNEFKIEPQSSSFSSSPDYDALMASANDDNDVESGVTNFFRKDSFPNNSNASNSSATSEYNAYTSGDNEKLNSMEVDDEDELDEIKVIEPYISSSSNLQNHSVSKMENSRASSCTANTSSFTSSPILPFENIVNKQEDKSYEGNIDDEQIQLGASNIYDHSSLLEPSKSIEEISYNPSYRFEPPSDAFMRSTLEKLKIPFIRKSLHFWAEVLYTEIPTTSSPESTFAITSSNDSFFKCLSCFFTGNENYYFFIKAGIQSYFYNNFKNFESDDEIDFSTLAVTSEKFQQFYQCNKLTNAHFNFICQWLQCRIGIFTNNDIFQKYGNWNDRNDDENIPILLIQNKRNFYKPVLTLI